MVLSTELLNRSEGKCELCTSTDDVSTYIVPPKSGNDVSEQVALCGKCTSEVELGSDEMDVNHFRCLNESMWNMEPAVQVLSYRLLNKLSEHSWAADAMNMMYMDDATSEWAHAETNNAIVHVDSNGHVLAAGDSVTLIQDLNVKGSSMVAKRGTAVRRIRLVPDNPEHIEGKVDGQQIVILTKFVKKS